jgi:tRNA U34 2-thiouridine synthase MnmA/TrmU
MNINQKKSRGLGLCSGGLDSILAGLVLREQGLSVEWITFETPFFSSEKARNAARITGIPLTVHDITQPYMKMLRSPNCGYGKYMNPCLDCHALMFRMAGDVMKARGFDFLFSGEVMGQRPMSQTRPSLRYVEKHSGFDGFIVRPLSAKRLAETIPEKEGLVDREALFGIAGRSRKEQIQLARHFGITEYPAPAGGCLLTDKGYANRLQDLFAHQEDYSDNELYMLRHGRHFRINSDTKIIVGRTKADNEQLERYQRPSKDMLLKIRDFPGPLVLIPNGAVTRDTVCLAASICAGYSKAPADMPVQVSVTAPTGRETVTVLPMPPDTVSKYLLK